MEQNIFNLNDKIYSYNNHLLYEIKLNLDQLMNYSNDNFSKKILQDVINKINYMMNENKKLFELIKNNEIILIKTFGKIDKIKKQLKRDDGKYNGHVINGKAEGKGIAYFNNGDKYDGEWCNDKKEGNGIYYFNNGARYEGYFIKDKRDGKGIYFYHNGDIYEGYWKNGLKEGRGIKFFHNGDRYEGEYKNDKKEGKGIMYYNNGHRYEGCFINGKREG